MATSVHNAADPMSATVEGRQDFDPGPKGDQQYWLAEIYAAEQENFKWCSQGSNIIKKYMNNRDAVEQGDKRFNLFWANTNILRNALYAALPKPEVNRKFRDQNDAVARVASLVLERGLHFDMSQTPQFNDMMEKAVLDRLLPGMGCCWVRYESVTGTRSQPVPGTDNVVTLEFIDYQGTPVDYVHWQDMLWSPARIWEEVRWGGRRVYMDRQMLIARFGEEKGKQVPLDHKSNNDLGDWKLTPNTSMLKQAIIYEIWDKTSRKVFWIAKGMDAPLDKRDDPYELPDFWPFPEPMWATQTSLNLLPVSDYVQVQDQYLELDSINNRLSSLIQACKAVGVYDKNAEGIQRLMLEGVDNTLIPVDNWAAFAEKGGLKGAIDWLPMEAVVVSITQLNAARETIKQQIYELTGISDIIRGSTKASETLGAQELKAQYAGVRLGSMQRMVGKFVTETLKIKAFLMLKFYEDKKLIAMAGDLLPADKELVPQAIQMLRDDKLREYRIEVSTDTFTDIDWQQEKASRTEFLTAVGGFLERALTTGQALPELTPMLLGLMKFGVAGFKVGREVEGLIDQGMALLIQKAAVPPPPPPPDPKIVTAEIAAETDKEVALTNQEGDIAVAIIKKEGDVETTDMKGDTAMEVASIKESLSIAREVMKEMGLQNERNHAMLEAKQSQEIDTLKAEMKQIKEDHKKVMSAS